jgi:hypothetical protein
VGSYTLTVSAVAAGSFTLSLRNESAGNLSEAVVINFLIPYVRLVTPVAASTVHIANLGAAEYTNGNAANTLTVRTEYKIVSTIAGGV